MKDRTSEIESRLAAATNELKEMHGLNRRYWREVKFSDGCWEWIGQINHNGYGVFNHAYKHQLAHRVGFRMVGLEVPEGKVVDHVCRNRKCVRIDHLRIVDMKTNTLENSLGMSALNARKTHCSKGHEFSSDNTRNIRRPKTGSTYRRCLECYSVSLKQRREKKAQISAMNDGRGK